MTTLTRRRPAASSAPAILPATLHSLTRTGRGDIVVRQPRFAEGDVVDGHRIGAPELWERPGGWTPEQIAERPPLITPARAQELLLALASNGPMPEWAEAYCTREAS